MRDRAKQARTEELRALRGQKSLDADSTFCWAICPVLLASLLFATHALLAHSAQKALRRPQNVPLGTVFPGGTAS